MSSIGKQLFAKLLRKPVTSVIDLVRRLMIAPVTFAGIPRDLVRPVDDTVGLLPPDGVPYNVDQWDV